MEKQIKVMVVDDSAVVRQLMAAILESDPAIRVIDTAVDPIFAQMKMENCWPDVITLDIEMPRMDGLTFTRKIMAKHPTPIVICSSLTEQGTKLAIEVLQAGAVEVITKPKVGVKTFLSESAAALIRVVKAAARSRPTIGAKAPTETRRPPEAVLPPAGGPRPLQRTTDRLVAIGTSTGGTQTLERILKELPQDAPGLVIVQHMPEKFTRAFAERLNGLCTIRVKEAEDNDRIVRGQALIAPGGRHMLVKRSGAHYLVEVKDGPLVSRHRPSVDVLFRSVAQAAGVNAFGIIMTGMGDDGVIGLDEMREAGAQTVAQDEASCIVFGMPKVAIERGAAQRVLPLEQIPAAIIGFGSGTW